MRTSPAAPRGIGWFPSASLTALLFFAFLPWAMPLEYDDLGWHLRVGQFVLEQHRVPTVNFLSWTAPTHPWVTHEWAAGVIFELVYGAGGAQGLIALRTVMFLVPVLLFFRIGRRRGAEAITLVPLLAVASWVVATQASLRPWLFTNLLLAVEVDLLLRWREDGKARRLWWIPLLLVAWVNLHGAWVVGPVLLVASAAGTWLAAGEKRPLVLRAVVPVAAACALAPLINPRGLETVLYPFRYVLQGPPSDAVGMMQQMVVEWSALPVRTLFGATVVVLVAATLAALLFSRPVRRDPAAWLGLLFLLLTFKAQRHGAIGAILSFPAIVDGLLAPLARAAAAAKGGFLAKLAEFSAMESIPRTPCAALAGSLLVAGMALNAANPDFEKHRMVPEKYPLEAIAALRALPPGRLLNEYRLCGPLAWKAPQWPLFITGVFDAFPPEVFQDYLAVAFADPGFEGVLDRWQVDTVLMGTHAAPMDALRADPRWKVSYTDEYATLLVRVTTPASSPAPR